jgi:hypothetical protein
MVSTGRHHGFESLEEARLLLALDFAGQVREVVSQPFRLRFTTLAGAGEHIPDVLAVTGDGTWLFDVRPAGRIGDGDKARFAAAAELALSCGWRYLIVTGWRGHVMSALDALSSRRRPMSDPLGLRELLLSRASRGGRRFGELAAGTPADPVAFGMPAGRQLPAVTKNKNYPQPVKHLKPAALGLGRGLRRHRGNSIRHKFLDRLFL